jgi:stage IV sporulation protein FB
MFRFAIAGFPITVHWFFWLTCAMLGGGFYAKTPEDWLRVLVWAVVVFVSITVHELGHAFAGRRFGAWPSIRLHGLGGVTFLPGAHFTRKQGIIVSAAGPIAGLLLGIVVLAASQVLTLPPGLLRVAVLYALYVNFFWTFVNLLPIQPLDGGQILRDILGPRYLRVTCVIGGVLAAAMAILALMMRMPFLALLMGFLAYHNFTRQQQVEGGVVTQ